MTPCCLVFTCHEQTLSSRPAANLPANETPPKPLYSITMTRHALYLAFRESLSGQLEPFEDSFYLFF